MFSCSVELCARARLALISANEKPGRNDVKNPGSDAMEMHLNIQLVCDNLSVKRTKKLSLFNSLRSIEWGVGVVQGGLRPGKVVKDSLSAFVTVCDSSEAEVLR